LKKGGSNINIPAKSTYVEFVPGFFDIKNWPGNTLLTLTLTLTLNYILWDGMKFDGRQLKDGHKDKDTHNNQPKTRGDNGGCKERWHYHQGCERPTFGGDIIVGSRYVD